MRILALDIGDKRIGVAMSDPLGILASPLTIIERHQENTDARIVVDLAVKNNVVRIIAGLPLSLDGTAGGQAEKVKEFVGQLAGATDIPVEFRDERLTTVSARRLIQSARTKKGMDRRPDDAFAAAVILQSYLDEKPPAGENDGE